MPSFQERLAEERRRKVLEALNEGGRRLPEDSIKSVLRHIFDDSIGRDDVRHYIEFCERGQLVKVDRMTRGDGSEMWVVNLTEAGQAVARGRTHTGIAALDAM